MGWQERKEGGNSAPTTASIKITLRPTGFSIQSSSSDDYFISSPVGCTSSHGRNTQKKIRGADTIVELEQMDRRSTKSRTKKAKSVQCITWGWEYKRNFRYKNYLYYE